MSIDDELIDRVLEGEASAEQFADVEQWLNDPAHLEQFLKRAELHADLRQALRRRSLQACVQSDFDDIETAPPPSQTSGQPVPRSARRSLFIVVTGPIAVACLIAVVMRFNSQNEMAAASVATVIMEIDTLLEKDRHAWRDTSLPAGRYHLKRGLLNLRFGTGVLAYLEAPAQFDAVSAERVVLHSGRLSARVSLTGIGFTVETPDADVVDLGTEFSVDVDAGASEVHVFDGLVHVHPGASKSRDASSSVELQASEAVRINRATALPTLIEIASDRFIRDFEEPKRRYARSVKRLSPIVYYRMPIRDRGLVSEPPDYSGVVLTGSGRRPPHARGVFHGGSLRVQADSTGRGGRIDTAPDLTSGDLTLVVFVYFKARGKSGNIATNLDGDRGNFCLSVTEQRNLSVAIRNRDGNIDSLTAQSKLNVGAWHQVVMSCDGKQLQIYMDGRPVASKQCLPIALSHSEAMWLGTDRDGVQLWNGRIDELAVFDKVLTDREIEELWLIAQEEHASSR